MTRADSTELPVLENATALAEEEEERIDAFERARSADDIKAILGGHSYGKKEDES